MQFWRFCLCSFGGFDSHREQKGGSLRRHVSPQDSKKDQPQTNRVRIFFGLARQQIRPVNFRCGLGGRQGPERRSTRSIVAFERYTARVLPATIAELCFQVFSDLISERSRSQISEAQKQILFQKCLMQTKCNSAMDE